MRSVIFFCLLCLLCFGCSKNAIFQYIHGIEKPELYHHIHFLKEGKHKCVVTESILFPQKMTIKNRKIYTDKLDSIIVLDTIAILSKGRFNFTNTNYALDTFYQKRTVELVYLIQDIQQLKYTKEISSTYIDWYAEVWCNDENYTIYKTNYDTEFVRFYMVSEKENLLPTHIYYLEFNSGNHLFPTVEDIFILSKFHPKNKNIKIIHSSTENMFRDGHAMDYFSYLYDIYSQSTIEISEPQQDLLLKLLLDKVRNFDNVTKL